jgi:hypothetical protein
LGFRATSKYVISNSPENDGSVLQLVWFPSATTATNFIGQYIETQG